MNCEELRGHYDLYALDIAEDPEAQRDSRPPQSRMRGLHGWSKTLVGNRSPDRRHRPRGTTLAESPPPHFGFGGVPRPAA